MKRNLLLMFSMVLIITITACSKKDREKESSPGLKGTWELRHFAGGSVAGLDPNFKPGNGNVVKFTDHEYEVINAQKSVIKTTYELKEEKIKINDKESTHSLELNNGTKLYLSLHGKKLIIFLGQIAADGSESTYEKQ